MKITWWEYIDRYTHGDTLQEYYEGEESWDILKPDELVNGRLIYEAYNYWESPNRLAFRFLEDLDLGPELDDDNGVGQINFRIVYHSPITVF